MTGEDRDDFGVFTEGTKRYHGGKRSAAYQQAEAARYVWALNRFLSVSQWQMLWPTNRQWLLRQEFLRF